MICNHCGTKTKKLFSISWKSRYTNAEYSLCLYCYRLLYDILYSYCRIGAPEDALSDDLQEEK